jgi:vancomycin resistance protein YoaR
VRTRSAALAVLAVLALLVLAVGTAVAVRAGEALPGTTVSGIDVGGLGGAELRARVEGLASEATTGTLQLVHEELAFPVQRADLGVSVDVDTTVARALTAGRTGGLDRVLGPLLGRGEPVELGVDVEGEGLTPFVGSVRAAVDREPFPGGIAFDGGQVVAQPPQPGRTLDVARAEQELAEALATGREEPLPLPVEQVDPGTTADDVERVAAQARDALASPLRLVGPEGVVLELDAAGLGPLLRAEPAGGALELAVDREQLTAVVQREKGRLDRPAVDAAVVASPPPPTVDTQGDLTWTPQPATVTATGGRPGLAVDVDGSVEALVALVAGPEQEAPLPAAATEPALRGDDLASTSRITSLLGTFTTYYAAGQPRAQNIRRIAEVVDGAAVAPGQSFSLNGRAGPRTRSKGYVADGAIINGQLEDVVGGGVSQFATTLFNAAFFAGLPIEQHQPHSFYISRYPAGRESTVNFGSIDVVVRNDTDAPFVIKTSTTGRSVTVAIYGDNGGRQVSSRTGPRKGRSGGGFTIEVTRTVTGGDGRGGNRVFRTVYNPPPPD